jgi:predicted dienelactone hydrolase
MFCTSRLRDATLLWKPAGPQPASGYPVVLFSHGYTGCNTLSTFLMQALAGAGYLVLAPNHKDAVCGTPWHPGKLLRLRPQEPFLDASHWSDATYKDRDLDIESVLDGWPLWKDGRIKAVLTYSPHCSPYILRGAIWGI